MQSPPQRIIIVDDHPRVRQGLSVLIETLGGWDIVGEAKNGQEAVDLCGRLQPNVVLMDLLMPIMDGITATRHIHEQYPQIKVLVLTSSVDQTDYQAALDAGATGFVTKYASMGQIQEALRKISGANSQQPPL